MEALFRAYILLHQIPSVGVAFYDVKKKKSTTKRENYQIKSTNLKNKTKSKSHRKLIICLAGHQQQIRKNKAAFYKTENCPINDTLVITSNERDAGEFVLTMNICPQSFLRENYTFNVKFIKRIVLYCIVFIRALRCS